MGRTRQHIPATAAVCALTGLLLLTALSASAQEAPAPHRSPRTAVNREYIGSRRDAVLQTRQVQGQPTVLDGERLRINDVELRLFGIVPPQLSASFGPQARAVVDNVATGQMLTCQIRDRDNSGSFLATCHNGNNADPALELLKRGLAVTARGSLTNSDLAPAYLAAEQAAQASRLGLWSSAPPAPAAIPQIVEAPKVQLVKPESVTVIPTTETRQEKTAEALPTPVTPAKTQSVLSPVPQPVITAVVTPALEPIAASDGGVGFIERYQLLLTGLVLLVTALSILGIINARRRREKRDEIRAIAAALRGELMAARSVCQSRAKMIATSDDDAATAWPRLRATLYQAYVGRLGFLGAELARQIASIYGQASDYAAFYNSDSDLAETTPKRLALQNLVQYIDEVMPRLAYIEQTGHIPGYTPQTGQPAYMPSTNETNVRSRVRKSQSAAQQAAQSTTQNNNAYIAPQAQAEAESNQDVSPAPSMAQTAPVTPSTPQTVARYQSLGRTKPVESEPLVATQIVNPPPAPVASTSQLPPITAMFKAPPTMPPVPQHIQLWQAVRNFARERLPERHQTITPEDEGDYARMIEEEMANYPFEEEEHDKGIASYATKLRDTGS